jgi:hypothetical protein
MLKAKTTKKYKLFLNIACKDIKNRFKATENDTLTPIIA